MPGKHHLRGFKIAKNRLVRCSASSLGQTPPPLEKKLDPPLYLYACSPSLEPPISCIGYHWQLQKQPISRAFSGNLPKTTPKQYPPPPFPRKRELNSHSAPIMHSRGGGSTSTAAPSARRYLGKSPPPLTIPSSFSTPVLSFLAPLTSFSYPSIS